MSGTTKPSESYSRELLLIKLEVDQHRTDRCYQKWVSERIVVKGLYLQLRILQENYPMSRFSSSVPARVRKVVKLDTIDAIKKAIDEESVWYAHFHGLWQNERRRRQEMEQEIELL